MSHNISHGAKIIQQAKQARMLQKPSTFIDDLEKYESLLKETQTVIENNDTLSNIIADIKISIANLVTNTTNKTDDIDAKINRINNQINELQQKLNSVTATQQQLQSNITTLLNRQPQQIIIKKEPAPVQPHQSELQSFESEYQAFITEQRNKLKLKNEIINELKQFIKDQKL